MSPMSHPDTTQLRANAAAAALRLRLALGRRSWRGGPGNWAGAGTGSSIDFQDHRPYLPGDDPRHIDWAAYARSGQYIMKLYREEVSPRIDILLDTSRSMSFHPAKRARSLELLHFCLESSLALGASPQCHAVDSGHNRPIPVEHLIACRWDFPASPPPRAPDLARLPLRSGSLRILISDKH